MGDWSWVTTRLATGAALTGPVDVDELVAQGCTHVIDCREEFDDTALLSQHASCLCIGVPDDGQPKPPEWFKKGIDFALTALSYPNARVLVHCAGGINRGPSMAAAILMAWGLTPALAEQVIRSARPQVGLRYLPDAIQAVKTLGYV